MGFLIALFGALGLAAASGSSSGRSQSAREREVEDAQARALPVAEIRSAEDARRKLAAEVALRYHRRQEP